MIMIRSIVRPEKVDNVLAALMEAGFPLTEIHKAFAWLDDLADRQTEPEGDHPPPRQHSIRVYAEGSWSGSISRRGDSCCIWSRPVSSTRPLAN